MSAANVSYLRCAKCPKEAISPSSYCKKHLTEEINKAKDLIKQLETNP